MNVKREDYHKKHDTPSVENCVDESEIAIGNEPLNHRQQNQFHDKCCSFIYHFFDPLTFFVCQSHNKFS